MTPDELIRTLVHHLIAMDDALAKAGCKQIHCIGLDEKALTYLNQSPAYPKHGHGAVIMGARVVLPSEL
jgi:hypothetical protein